MRLDAEIGTLEAGKRADLLVVDGDPLADIAILRRRESLALVMKEGVGYAGSLMRRSVAAAPRSGRPSPPPPCVGEGRHTGSPLRRSGAVGRPEGGVPRSGGRGQGRGTRGYVMRIVDAQIHIWSGGLPEQHGPSAGDRVSPPDEAIAPDGRGRRRRGRDPSAKLGPEDDEMAVEAVRDYPGRFAIMGGCRSTSQRAAAGGDLAQTSRACSGCATASCATRAHWLEDGTLDWLWAAAEQAGVPIAMLATDSLRQIGAIAERHPGLRLTIDHLGGRGGNTTLKDDAAMEHMPELLKLARHPNVAVKATGAPGYSSGPYPFPACTRT